MHLNWIFISQAAEINSELASSLILDKGETNPREMIEVPDLIEMQSELDNREGGAEGLETGEWGAKTTTEEEGKSDDTDNVSFASLRVLGQSIALNQRLFV